MKKRVLSLLLTLVMLLGLLPMGAQASDTPASPIKLGDYVQMGTYDTDGDGTAEPILWRCVSFEKITGTDENGTPIVDSADTVTEYRNGYLPLMLSDDIVCRKAFDAPGDNTSGSHGRAIEKRKIYGSSYWGDSNLRDWLNSSATAGNVVWSCGNEPIYTCDQYSYDYSDEAGFLTNFSAKEQAAMQAVVQKATLAEADIGLEGQTGSKLLVADDDISACVSTYSDAYSQWFTDTMFVMDVQQLYNVQRNDGALGGEGYYNLGNTHGDWLRTPFYYPDIPSFAQDVLYSTLLVTGYLDRPGGLIDGSPRSGSSCGVRPAFYFNLRVGLTGSGTKEAPYQPRHLLTHYEAKEPTCTDGGNEEYWQCEVCGKLFADADGITELDAAPTVKAKGHEWGKWKLQQDGETVALSAALTPDESLTLERVCSHDDSHTETKPLVVEVEPGEIAYDGQAHTPEMVLTAGENERLTPETDYVLSYNDNVNAGAATVTVTGQGDYELTLEREFTIGKATAPAATPGSLNIANHLEKEYTFALARLLPQLNPEGITENRKDWGSPVYTIESVQFDTAGYYDETVAAARIVREDGAAILHLPIQASSGEEVRDKVGAVTVKVTSTNYMPFLATLNINATNKTLIHFEGVTVESRVYNGQPIAYTGTLKAVTGDGQDVTGEIPVENIEITYVGVDGTAHGGDRLKNPPFNAGSFAMVVRVADADEHYIGVNRFPFQIEKADGTGNVTMADFVHGGARSAPVPSSETNGVSGVSLAYKAKGAGDDTYTDALPTDAGTYTVRAVFPATLNYNAVTATADFTVSHTATGEWQKDGTGHWRLCICGEAMEKTAHVYDNSQDTSCNTCGYTRTVSSGGSGGASEPDTYRPNIRQPEHGKLTVSPAAPSKGRTVTITVKPDQGYEVEAVTVTDKNGKAVEVTKNADGTYSYVQPSGRVNIAAEIKEARATEDDNMTPAVRFTDVSDTAWYYDAVYYCTGKGLMEGVSETTFAPNMTTSRAMIATILWRLAGEPETEGLLTYPDCAVNSWYARAVAWAGEVGVVTGYGSGNVDPGDPMAGGNFGPDDPITREQLAVMLGRYTQVSGKDISVSEDTNILSYVDFVQVGEWAIPAIQWATGSGVMKGKGSGILDPKGEATRAEVAAMLMRYCEFEK